MLQLAFTDHRPEVLQVWKYSLGSRVNASFTIRQASEDVWDISTADALALPTVIAHQLCGGMPVIGRSQVLRGPDRADLSQPRWVVTTVPFPAELNLVNSEDAGKIWKLVPRIHMDRSRESFLLFKGMLQAIEAHNDLYIESQIYTFSVDLAFVGITHSSEEAEAASTAIISQQQQPPSEDEFVDTPMISWTQNVIEARPPTEGAWKESLLKSNPFKMIRDIYLTSRVRNKVEKQNTRFGEVVETILRGDVQSSYLIGDYLDGRKMTFRVTTQHSGIFRVVVVINFRWGRISVHDIEPEENNLLGSAPLLLPPR